MPPSRATHTRHTKNALIRNRTQRRSTDPGGSGAAQRQASPSPAPSEMSAAPGPSSSRHTPMDRGSEEPTSTGPNGRFRVQSRAAFLTWSKLTEEPTSGLVARYEAFCRNRPNHWATLAVVERHDPEEPNFDPDRPLHVHALTISQERKGGWNTQNARFWDFEGNHPNILQKGLQDGPGGNPARDAFHYLDPEGRTKGKRSREQADLEDGEEIVGSATRDEFYQAYKRLRPLDMTKSWNSIRAYAEFAYKTDAGLLPAIPVNLEAPEYRDHIDQADRWFDQEVRPKGPGMRHRILVIEGETGTGKTAYARSKGSHSRMCNVWNVANLSEDADVWILDDMVSTNGKYSLKALSQYEADFTGRYQRVKTMKAPTPSVENSVAKPVLFNPPVTPEIAAIATKVVSEARSRVGKKKNGPEDNSLKEHARTRFYRMIGINAAKSIPPHYEDEYGEPDTLPLLFTDPETGYCTPKVHWKAVLTKQLAWVPTYLLWFRSTIPNDKSEVSTVLRSLTDEQIIILLHDGPLRTCQTMFRDKKKSEEELVEMRVQSLEYHRRDKASSLILQSHNTRSHCSDWEFLYHPGFMSQDESDGEGGVVTKRPEYRAQWVTNLYEAIRVAQMNKARTQPGISPCPSRRRIEIVKRPISQLERGTGSSRVPVRIALCAISRSWRNVHAAELLKSQHLVNSKANAKPNIDSFLAQHPMPDDGEDADNEGDGIDTGRREFFQPVDAFVDRHDMAQGMNEACGAVGPSDDNKSHDGGLNIASASASEADNLEESIGIHEGGTGFNLAARYQGNAIDPELQQSIHANYAKPGGNSHGSPSELAATGSITWAAQELLDTPQNCSQMPPPPFPPSHNLIGASDSSVTLNLNTAKPKRRGRPPGSKNKPKPQAGSLLDHQL
ncbi:hypothetical protein RhiLY_00117 [Ceratobasidium sp. AG-Ba]|nr:hypothetical protein RhiLY_00117 [Ceratobasidium sp. AG-Ba]